MNTTFDHLIWSGVRICGLARLPSFDSEAASKASNEANGSLPVLARWRCAHCGGVHHWSTEASDTNGGHRTGTMVVPDFIRTLCDKSPEVYILVPRNPDETGAAYAQATKRQARPSVVREQIMDGEYPRQTKEARELGATRQGFGRGRTKEKGLI